MNKLNNMFFICIRKQIEYGPVLIRTTNRFTTNNAEWLKWIWNNLRRVIIVIVHKMQGSANHIFTIRTVE